VYFTCGMKLINCENKLLHYYIIITREIRLEMLRKYFKLMSCIDIWYETIHKSNEIMKLYTCEIDHKFSNINFTSNYEITN